MFEKSANDAEPVSFSAHLAQSSAFLEMFRNGMTLVEETAAYLDGPGRAEAKALDRTAALTYATESMRLTTRLMQLASWLLLHRAVREGEMSLSQANKEKNKVKLAPIDIGGIRGFDLLPPALRLLIERADTLQTRVRRFDATMQNTAVSSRAAMVSPVSQQLGLLKAAFEQDAH